ncbi:MAG: C39 family peptidase [Chloroflexota bacterium]
MVAVLLAAIGGISGQVAAQEATGTPIADEAASASPIDVNAMSLPPSVQLEGLTLVWQQLNRCSAGALTILLSYYDWEGDYTTTIRGLNPHMEDVSVRLDEMVAFTQSYGLRAIERTGGTIELLKVLTANGFPVLVENSYYDGNDINRDWMSHNRVITGYDDNLQVLYSFDSLLGAGPDGKGRPIPYDEFDQRWRPFNRDYLIVYRRGDEPLLEALLGPNHWDPKKNAEWTLAQAESELAEAPDSYAAFNRGSALVALGRYEEAAEAFDQARSVGLPWRFLWYQFGPFEAYLRTGRYDDVLTLVRSVLDATPGVEEVYYYAALAYAAQGDLARAEANLEVALQRNINLQAAKNALDTLRAGRTPEPPAIPMR